MTRDPNLHALLDRLREAERRIAELEALTGVYRAIKGRGCSVCSGLGVRAYPLRDGSAEISTCGACVGGAGVR